MGGNTLFQYYGKCHATNKSNQSQSDSQPRKGSRDRKREKNHTKSFHVCLIGKCLLILVGWKYKAAILQVRQMNIEHLSEWISLKEGEKNVLWIEWADEKPFLA